MEDIESVVTEKDESKSEDVERDESKSELIDGEESKSEVIDGEESESEVIDREESQSEEVGKEEFKSDIIDKEESKSEVIDKEESKSGVIYREESQPEFIDREVSQSEDVEREESKSVVVKEESNLEEVEAKELNSKNIGGELALQSDRQLELEYIEEAEVVCPSEPIKEKDVEKKTELRGSEDSDGVSDVSDWIAGERPSAEHNKGDTVSHQNNTDQVDCDEGYSQPDTSHTICQEQDKPHIENDDTPNDDESPGEPEEISFGSGKRNVRFSFEITYISRYD